MSKRNRASTSRRAKQFPLVSNDDVHTCALSFLMARPSRSRRKSTPQRRIVKKNLPQTLSSHSVEVICLDDTPESMEITNTVESKVKTFIEGFLSSDEDEIEDITLKPTTVSSCSGISYDDNLKICNKPAIDCEASTSSAFCCDNKKINGLEDDIMVIVDSVLDENSDVKENKLTDMKSLEDFRKQTEEMLQNASKLLDEFKTGRTTEPENKLEPEPENEKNSVQTVAVLCPICLESLSDRSASVTICGHIFCSECLKQAAKNMKKCPTCRKQINAKKIHPIYL